MNKELKIKIAMKMVVLDAIEKGYTDAAVLAAYVKSNHFEKAVKSYMKIIETTSETVLTCINSDLNITLK
jgi:menaquinone-dependent protoporphyrinogen IX oxidase